MSRATFDQASHLLKLVTDAGLAGDTDTLQRLFGNFDQHKRLEQFFTEHPEDGRRLFGVWLDEQANAPSTERVEVVSRPPPAPSPLALPDLTRLTDPAELLLKQAQRIWERREPALREDLGFDSFEQYLEGPSDPRKGVTHVGINTLVIPTAWPEAWIPANFDRTVIVEGRLADLIGLTRDCGLIGLVYGGNDRTFEPFDPAVAERGLRLMRTHDGRRNRDVSVVNCRKRFRKRIEVGADAVEVSGLWLMDPSILDSHAMDAPGSVHAGDRRSVACVEHWGDGPGLHWDFRGYADPSYGSVSRGSGKAQT